MILERYLLREICKPLAAVLGVLVILFTGYGAARFLANAVNGLLPAGMIFQLVGLRTLIALEVLIPISLYVSVVLAFGRMYGDSEFTAMSALGLPPARVMGTVALLSACMAVAVAGLSLMVRPWAYRTSHELSNAAAAPLSTSAMEAGTFYVGSQGNRTIFIERRAGPGATAHNVFVQLKRPDGTRIIYARTARQTASTKPGTGAQMQLTDAHVYDIPRGRDGGSFVMHVKHLVVQLASPRIEPPGYSSVAASTAYLAGSSSAPDIAELEWRLSTSVSTLLLGMMGVPLARSRPREHKYARMGIAILIYAGYYLFYESVRTWVQNGVIPALPGLWWAPGTLAAVLIGAWVAPRLAWRRRRA